MSAYVGGQVRDSLRSKLVVGAALALMTVAAWAAHRAPEPAQASVTSNTLPGESKPLGNGTIWSWVKTDLRGRATAVGISFTESALQNLPQTGGKTCCDDGIALTLPTSARALPFTHAVVNWNPQGHEPRPIYGVSHFDFHFYTITAEQRNAITANEADAEKLNKAPESKYLPAGYVMAPGSGMSKMGIHWVDPSSPEFNGQVFTRTFIYGSYDGKLAFVEPMISKAYLDTKPNAADVIKTPMAFAAADTAFPTRYTVTFDAESKVYSIALEGMISR